MKFVVDRNIPFITEMFRGQADVLAVDGHTLTSDMVRGADALLVRSVTQVNEALLAGSAVRFVGTSTTGFDHVDIGYLREHNIAFASAPGSNANSVAEYFVAALHVLASRYGLQLEGTTVGVVGMGNVGSRVVHKAAALGMNVLQNDPPRADAAPDPHFLPLDDLMQADIITLHVPLTGGGAHPTYHLFDEQRIARMKKGSILINTARGAVVDTQALKAALKGGHLSAGVFDVWEGEPLIDTEALAAAALGTPHIAGHSTDGKVNGASMIYDAVCRHFGLPNTWSVDGRLPQPSVPSIRIASESGTLQETLRGVLTQCHPIEEDDARLRVLLSLPADRRAQYFEELRTTYPGRREWPATTVHVPAGAGKLAHTLSALGFSVVAGSELQRDASVRMRASS